MERVTRLWLCFVALTQQCLVAQYLVRLLLIETHRRQRGAITRRQGGKKKGIDTARETATNETSTMTATMVEIGIESVITENENEIKSGGLGPETEGLEIGMPHHLRQKKHHLPSRMKR